MNQAIKEHTLPAGIKLQLVHGDITDEKVDAIVNAANSQLRHGAGVAGAIVRAGGSQIQVESDQWVREHGPVTHAEPAYTHAGRLPCRYIIHAVGPEWGEGEEESNLKSAIQGSLRLADRLGLSSIAFPAVSTGIFGFPKALAAQVMLSTILEYQVQLGGPGIKLIRLVLYDQDTLQAFIDAWDQDDHLNP